MDSFLGEILIVFLLICLNAYFAAAEIAIISVREIRIRQLADKGNRAAQTVLRLTEDSSRMLATIQIGITLAGFLASASAAISVSGRLGKWLTQLPVPFLAQFGSGIAVVTVTLVLSYFTLVFGELAPKRMALQKAESIALRVAGTVDLLARVAGPMTSLLTWSTNVTVKLLGGDPNNEDDEVTEEEIKAFVEEHGSMPEDEKDMIQSVFEFGDSAVADVMVPRIDIVAVTEDTTVASAISILCESGYSRLPVFHDSIDNIVGIANLKDLLDYHFSGRQDLPVCQVMRKPLVVPEQKKAIALFHEMQKQRAHMAVVADEFGGTAGLVTMENLLEVVVGDIRDEHDGDEQDDFTALANSSDVSVLGSVAVHEINDELGWGLPEHEDYDTIGGLVFSYLGRVPSAGDELTVNGIRFIVEKMDNRRIERIRLSHTDAADSVAVN